LRPGYRWRAEAAVPESGVGEKKWQDEYSLGHAIRSGAEAGKGASPAGNVAAVMGTYTHVPTAGPRVLPGGTAYDSDVGMTGGREGIIGFNRDGFMRVFLGEGDL
jgi:hypothetical protein